MNTMEKVYRSNVMSIFVLNKKEPEVENKVTDKPEEKVNDSTTIKEITENDGKEFKGQETENKDSKTATVIIDGPLGEIYTNALNIVFAKEEAIISERDLNVLENEDLNHDENYYIYCLDQNDLDDGDNVNKIFSMALDESKVNKMKKIVCIESSNIVSNKLGVIGNFCHKNNIQVIHNRSIAISKIKKIF